MRRALRRSDAQVCGRCVGTCVSTRMGFGSGPGRLRIQTIDSFNFRLATQLTVTAKAGGSLLIMNDRTNCTTERPGKHWPQQITTINSRRTLSCCLSVSTTIGPTSSDCSQTCCASAVHWLRYVLGHEPGALCERISKSLGEIVSDHLRGSRGAHARCASQSSQQACRGSAHSGQILNRYALGNNCFVDPDGKRGVAQSHYQGTWTRNTRARLRKRRRKF